MTMMRGQFSQLMAPGLHGEFVHWVDTLQREEEFSHILHVEPSDKPFEDEVEFSGLPPMPLKPESEATIYQDALQGGTKRYINLINCRLRFGLQRHRRSEEHTSELQSQSNLVCRLMLEKNI